MGTGYEARGSGMDSAYSIYETLLSVVFGFTAGVSVVYDKAPIFARLLLDLHISEITFVSQHVKVHWIYECSFAQAANHCVRSHPCYIRTCQCTTGGKKTNPRQITIIQQRTCGSKSKPIVLPSEGVWSGDDTAEYQRPSLQDIFFVSSNERCHGRFHLIGFCPTSPKSESRPSPSASLPVPPFLTIPLIPPPALKRKLRPEPNPTKPKRSC
jgi:hypothetical protein